MASRRFAPGPFAHNGAAAVCILPALAAAALQAGGAGGGACLAGLLLAYVLDLARQAEATLGVLWATLASLYLCLVFGASTQAPLTPPLLEVLTLLVLAQTLFLAGVWATLQARPPPLPLSPLTPRQFKFVQFRAPGLALAGERLLLAAAPLNGLAAVGWAASRALGAAAAPFALCPYAVALALAAALPRHSSFTLRAPGPATAEARVLSRGDVRLVALACAALPAALHAGAQHSALAAAAWGGGWGRLDGEAAALLLLLSPVPLALCLATPWGALWWAAARGGRGRGPEPPWGNTPAFALSLSAFLLGFSGHVLLPSLRPFLHPPPPFDAALLAAAVSGAAFAAAALWRLAAAGGGALPASAGAAASAAALAAGLALGLPLHLLPAPVAAAAGALRVASALASARRPPLAPLLLAALTSLTLARWFVQRHLLRLQDELVGGLPLPQLGRGLLASAALAALALAAPAARLPALGSAALAAHSALFVLLEASLYEEAAAGGHTQGVYPRWLLAATLAAGLALPAALRAARRLPRFAAWLVAVAHGAKAPLLLLSGGGADRLLPSALLLAAASAPFALPPRRMSAPRAAAHCAAFLAALLPARFLVFDSLFDFSGRRPSDSLVAAAFAAAVGAFAAALAARHFPAGRGGGGGGGGLRAAALALLCAAAGLAALRPPLPWRGAQGWFYDSAHVPDPEPDEAAVYGAAAGRGRRLGAGDGAPAWLLIGAAAAAAAGGARGGAGARAAALGAAFGHYTAQRFFPPASPLLTMLAVLACAACGLALARVHAGAAQAAAAYRTLPLLLFLQLLPLPLSLLEIYAPAIDAAARGLEEAGGAAGRAAARAEAAAAVAALHAALCVALAFAARLRAAAAAPPPPRVSARRDTFSPLARGPARGAGPPAAIYGPLRGAGDAATWAAFGLALALARGVSGGEETAVLLLSPLLLLLNEEGPGSDGWRRYAPPAAAVAAVLAAQALEQTAAAARAGEWAGRPLRGAVAAAQAAAAQRAAEAAEGAASAGAHAAAAALSAPPGPALLAFLARNCGAVAAAAPSITLFIRFLRAAPRPPDALLMALAPTPVLPGLLAEVRPARLLCALAVAAAALQLGVQGRRRAASARAL